ncbi:uncharacterized protein LY89DRAFT_738825 [Mollisia scopiformis]|uniref:Uncharacterized protein n=1 Tax=Mollisia scopiformis TaxID=149040 RepID=A0A194WX91_MOLSC|nr:uncharacterized protein LY89DRAFT_738825 [Mollisia scopiformis]KUJ12207.1 hypothetical protein LY89DRAFT_738825 [Mollisia scopiformis]
MPLYVVVPDHNPLHDPISHLWHQSLLPLTKVALLDSFLGDPGPLFDTTRKSPNVYLSYVETTIRGALYAWSKYKVKELKFLHITKGAELMCNGRSREEIEGFLQETFEKSAYNQQGNGQVQAVEKGDERVIVGEIVDLIVRLRWMVPVWSFWEGVSPENRETSLTWVDGSVRGAFQRQFRARSRAVSESGTGATGTFEGIAKLGANGIGGDVRFEKGWCLRVIEKEMGCRIVWTSNLLDHLRFREHGHTAGSPTTEEYPEDTQRTLCVFHHAAFLSYQIGSDVYPEGLIEETLRTLSLLLPSSDNETQDWFLRNQIQYHLDGEAARCKPLPKEQRNIENFRYWRDRLTTLKQAYDRSKPQDKPKSLLRRYLSVLQLNNT